MFKNQPKPPRYRSIWSGGSLIVSTVEGEEVCRLEGSELVGNIRVPDGSLPLSSLANIPVYEGGAPSSITLLTTGVCADGESIELGDDVYILRLVTDDTNDDTANGEWDNENNPLVISGAVTSTDYGNVSWDVGDLIRVEDEIMEIIFADAASVHLARGVSGTTIAAHSDGEDIFQHATPASPASGQIFVGIVGTDADDMKEALAEDINNRGTEPFVADAASVAVNDEIFIQTADVPGGNYQASERVIAVDVTAMNMEIERVTGQLPQPMTIGLRQYVAQSHEVTNGFVQIPFNFTVEGFNAQVFDSGWVARNDLTDAVYAAENRVIIEHDGSTNIAATDVILVMAWGG